MRSSISSFKWKVIPLLLALYLAFVGERAISLQMGYSPEGELTERWLNDVNRFRTKLFADHPVDQNRKTVWIVAGSNSLFGTNSALIERSLRVNARNYSLQGNVHPNVMFAQIIDQVRPGDVVLAPLEFGVYDRKLGSVFDYANYFRYMYEWATALSLRDKYAIYSAVPLRRWVDGLGAYIFSPANAKETSLTTDEMMEVWQKRPAKLPTYYSFKALTDRGDFSVRDTINLKAWAKGDGLTPPQTISEVGISNLSRWKAAFEKKGAIFALTLPIILADKDAKAAKSEFWEAIEAQRVELLSADVPMQCAPEAALIGSRYRLDTIYHVNADGATFRTKALLPCLAQLLSGKPQDTTQINAKAMATKAATVFKQQDFFSAPK